MTPWIAAYQVSLSFTNSQGLLKLMSIESVIRPTISSSVVPFSPCLQSFPASGSFPTSWLFTSSVLFQRFKDKSSPSSAQWTFFLPLPGLLAWYQTALGQSQVQEGALLAQQLKRQNVAPGEWTCVDSTASVTSQGFYSEENEDDGQMPRQNYHFKRHMHPYVHSNIIHNS